ncbi:hypothetical protein CFOL_v3_11597 [Cephalotus follicularis]|uniref:Retrovirus-related Pol polyprotein from transposon TNT 1-94-like beta-barrel domain-containing protein n=1 Tax=Cephalotus follicularis TaxID=3775 RepID=A0A1Q3BJQ6_CEPFO|nr:hypothetical protein CFOL_v3_11597 [Cephalotus follicularis]
MDIGDIYIADSATTHTIIQSEKYFSHLTIAKANVGTISGTSDLIEGSGKASFVLSNGTQICITDTLYSTKSRRNLLSFKDIRRNGYHIEITNENGKEYLYITGNASGRKQILEKLPGARLLTQINKLRAQFPDYPIKSIRVDNAAEFCSKAFDELVFPVLGGDKILLKNKNEISWKVSRLHSFDPRTNECELQVQRIINL